MTQNLHKIKIILFMLMMASAGSGLLIEVTNAGWSDSEKITGHSITTGYWVAPSVELGAEPEEIEPGATSTLTWDSEHTTECQSEDFDTTGSTTGSVTVSPGMTTTYTLSCEGLKEDSKATATTTVTVIDSNGNPPNDQPAIGPGDVVVNEVMWMGSDAGFADQWIELRNMTDQDIDLGQWTIDNARQSNQPAYMIPAGTGSVIEAEDIFLITRVNVNTPNSALAVPADINNASINLANTDNGDLLLKDAEGNLIDEAAGDPWPAGRNDPNQKRWSMQRGQTPGDGLDPANWYTCDRDVLAGDGTLEQMNDYWQEGHQKINCGTPGHSNLSSNDPTKQGFVSPNSASGTTARTTGSTDELDKDNESVPDSEPKEEDDNPDNEPADPDQKPVGRNEEQEKTDETNDDEEKKGDEKEIEEGSEDKENSDKEKNKEESELKEEKELKPEADQENQESKKEIDREKRTRLREEENGKTEEQSKEQDSENQSEEEETEDQADEEVDQK